MAVSKQVMIFLTYISKTGPSNEHKVNNIIQRRVMRRSKNDEKEKIDIFLTLFKKKYIVEGTSFISDITSEAIKSTVLASLDDIIDIVEVRNSVVARTSKT